LPRAAEPATTFARPEPLDAISASPDTPGTWPAPGELAALRRRADAARKDARAGRHSRAVRQLRQSIAALARRGDWLSAGEGSAELAATLLRRGHAREALAMVEQARRFAARSGGEPPLVDIAVLAGAARIDLARLDEAESVLGAAVSAARTSGDSVRMAAARIGLARCVFWRGRYAEAAAALAESREAIDWPIGLRLRHRLLSARVGVGRGDFSQALSLVGDALQLTGGDASLEAAVRSTAAFVHLATGDLDAVDREGAAAIAAARSFAAHA